MNEIPMVSGWIYSRIVTDPTLVSLGVTDQRVWEYVAPDTDGFHIVYQRQEAGDVRGLGSVRLFTRLRYLIRVVDRGADWSHEAIANRIDALFDAVGPISVADPPGVIEASVRVEPFDQPETVGGVQYRHLGGIYEIAANAGV